MKNVLILGAGGREYAMCWSIAKNENISLFTYTDNSIFEKYSTIISPQKKIVDIIDEYKIDCVIPGSETYLAQGIADEISEKFGDKCFVFGPNMAAAQLESSKHFTKEICKKYDIPTAEYYFADTNDKAIYHIKNHFNNTKNPIVIKCNGLAAGKGVFIPHTEQDAYDAIKNSQGPWVIEQYITGDEFSMFYYVKDNKAKYIACACDFKRLYNCNEGPNTGGMGAYSADDIVHQSTIDTVQTHIIDKTMQALTDMNINYNGILYAGLMRSGDQSYLIEYNIRFGDPEIQAILPRLTSDFMELVYNGNFELNHSYSLCINACNKEYPFTSPLIRPITIDYETDQNINIFFSGVQIIDNTLYASGGRVMSVVGTDMSYSNALRSARYTIENKIHWDDMHYRTDIQRRIID